MKIFLLSPSADITLSSHQKEQLEQAGDLIIDKVPKPLNDVGGITGSEEKIIAIDPDFNNWKIKNEELEKIQNIKAICLQSTAYDWVDLEYCRKRNIVVINVQKYSTQSVAEWALMMVMNLARKIPLIKQNGWLEDFANLKGMELAEKTAGIIGLGAIGTKMAELCQGLGMNVQYWSKNTTNDKYQKVSLETLFATSDVILVALLENEETKKLITDKMLVSMKPSTIVSSIFAVHRLYNHQLVLDLVKDKKILGYGFEGHPGKFDEYLGNIWAGPSMAWCTDESLNRNASIWVDNIVKAARDNFEFRVN